MASVWKSPHSKYWQARIKLQDGRWVHRSTKETDRRKAHRIARELEDMEADAAAGQLTMLQVQKLASKAYEISTGKPIQRHTIESWFDFWMGDREKTTREKTFIRYRVAVVRFLECIGTRKGLGVRNLDVTDIEAFRESELSGGRSNRTVNLNIKIIRSALNTAQKHGVIESNPAAALNPLPNDSQEKKVFTVEQVKGLLEVANQEWKGCILLGFYTGARISDILALQVGDINFEKGCLGFVEKKKQDRHKKKVVVPFHPCLEAFLKEEFEQAGDGDYICPTLRLKDVGHRAGASQGFRRLMLQAGIIDELYQKKEKDTGAGRRPSGLSFHSFRHGFLSSLASAGVPKDVREAMTGHKKGDTGEGYTHREIDLLKNAVSHLPSLTTL
jgi:integrase